MNQDSIAALAGDSPRDASNIQNPFHLELKGEFRQWLTKNRLSLGFTTYEAGKLIIIGPGLKGGTALTERNFERCMALWVDDESQQDIYISTHYQIWKLENGLEPKTYFEGEWDRVYLPRLSYITGGVDVHDIMRAKDRNLYGVITAYNSIARITPDERGSFSPVWKPPFINCVIGEDRCHLNGLCLENGDLAYVSMVAQTNVLNDWKAFRADGGVIMDMRTNDILVQGLSMPHTPRMYEGKLWFLEAGKGYLCRFDTLTGDFERCHWLPGFLRGLRFYKNYALVCSSAPRDRVFEGLPLEEELKKRGVEAECAIHIINLDTMTTECSLNITGFVKEIYDVCLLEDCLQPLLYGIQGEDIRRIVVLGQDRT